MDTQQSINYRRIAQAIEYIKNNVTSQPDLAEIAAHVHLSPFHFQRLFSEWAGTTPKKFLQYISLQHAKSLLRNDRKATLFSAAHETGLSGTSRLHDLFVTIEGMTPAEYKNGGRNLSIRHSFAESPFGQLLVASTDRGICHMAFEDDTCKAVEDLKIRFPDAEYDEQHDLMQERALMIFQDDWSRLPEIRLHLKGTDFQFKVWESLLKIPMGKLVTYGSIAGQIGSPNASRAVGTAIGSNPVAFLIPCHRVIQSSGILGGYMWGPVRKTAIVGWESARFSGE